MSWMVTGKLLEGATQSPFPAPPTVVQLPPRLPWRHPAPPVAPLAFLPHPSLRGHLYSTSTVAFISLSRVSLNHSVYVFHLLLCAANLDSLLVHRVVSLRHQTCMQETSQMVRSTRSSAKRGASNNDPPP